MTRSLAVAFSVVVTAVAAVASAHAREDEGSPEVLAERDQLIDRIARGVDFDPSVKRFAELRAALYEKRDAAAAEVAKARVVVAAQRDWQETHRKSADYEVSWRCTLSPDPAHPLPSDEGRFRADWGKVVRIEKVRLPPKNDLDEGAEWNMLKLAGKKRSYLIHADKYGLPDRTPLIASVGDLLLICDGGSDSSDHAQLPSSWSGPIQRSGFAVPIQAPPKIVDKTRWNPRHVTGTVFFWAIHDVKWKYPPNEFVLSHLEIGGDLGGGRYQMEAEQGLSWVMEVPASLKHRELCIPGRSVWVILGSPHFDRALRKLVLVAEDLEESYVTPR